ncbi:hypothetical protein [Geobacillus thermodenitrificans]|uniref:hypothetical protein n=1 Tax=Geobacillus thermodenitrificans TaxID=33940 RepID=UPI002E1F5C4D|nr:hypothetical protein [Geobacillus thermodenitrificans]
MHVYTLLQTITANAQTLGNYVGLTGYFADNTSAEQAAKDSDEDPWWDYTAYVGTAKPTKMVVELVDQDGKKSTQSYSVTLLQQ